MRLLIIILLFSVFLWNCGEGDKMKSKIDDAVSQVEQNRKPFDPNLGADTTKVNLLFTFKIENRQIVQQPVKVEPVLGSIPYKSGGGNFKVTYKGNQNKEIGSFLISNPLVMRSCDPGEEPSPKYTETGEFTVLVPYSADLKYIEFKDEAVKDSKPVQIDLDASLKEFKIR